jgi:uncharacterized protein (DUF1015 family)
LGTSIKGGKMAELRPFKGVRYNLKKFADLAKVICPPYDIISPELQDRLYQNSEYNFVRIEFNKETVQDNDSDNRYSRAAELMSQWLKQGVLVPDRAPAFYLHEHEFTIGKKACRRQDLIAAVKLEEWDSRVVRPHENIIPRAKSDRMSMLQACQANTSAVLAMYEDPRKVIFNSLASSKQVKPLISFVDPWEDGHKVWAVTQPDLISSIRQEMTGHPLYIADGHHRYDSALTYQHQRKVQSGLITGEEGFNFVMISLIDFADPGLIILPTHRLIRGLNGPAITNFKSRLLPYFTIHDLPLNTANIWRNVDALLDDASSGGLGTKLAVAGLEPDCMSILTLKDFQSAARLMPEGRSEAYKKLDVSLVEHVIMDKLLAFDKDKVEGDIAYSHDREEALNQVRNQRYQLSFIMSPVKPELIKVIADAGDRMPRKSTYFYPKSPAGLVFYKW